MASSGGRERQKNRHEGWSNKQEAAPWKGEVVTKRKRKGEEGGRMRERKGGLERPGPRRAGRRRQRAGEADRRQPGGPARPDPEVPRRPTGSPRHPDEGTDIDRRGPRPERGERSAVAAPHPQGAMPRAGSPVSFRSRPAPCP